jgi:hypothetical protein
MEEKSMLTEDEETSTQGFLVFTRGEQPNEE